MNSKLGFQASEIIKCYGFAFIYLLIRKLNDISMATETVSLNAYFVPTIIHSRIYRHLSSLRSKITRRVSADTHKHAHTRYCNCENDVAGKIVLVGN